MTFYRDLCDDGCYSQLGYDDFYGFGGLNGFRFGSPFGYSRYGTPYGYRGFGGLYGNRGFLGYGGYYGYGDLYGAGYGYPFYSRFGGRTTQEKLLVDGVTLKKFPPSKEVQGKYLGLVGLEKRRLGGDLINPWKSHQSMETSNVHTNPSAQLRRDLIQGSPRGVRMVPVVPNDTTRSDGHK
ncbi:hypothetical protein WISP_28325 [Willisornis vidua]|uniref:Uncharacterized protein n=1 Tax=Willisornis vidua TaxID=1566151 RepID=A0ABQ9DL46_9PASS|nr:hypothetical protein WISP_28325 [Willisornis vidua]